MPTFPHAKTTPITAIAGIVASKVQGALEALKGLIDAITPGGSDGSLQFNDGGTFGGSTGLLWDDTAHTLTIQGSAATDGPAFGDELLTSDGWTVGAGWTESPDDVFAHSTGTEALSHSASIQLYGVYKLEWTIIGRTTGSITVSLGGRSLAGITASGVFEPASISTSALNIMPTTDFNGTLSAISLKQQTAGAVALLTLKDSGGTERLQVRANADNYNTFVGLNAGAACTIGALNSVGGACNGLSALTTGFYNSVGAGALALQYLDTGSGNSVGAGCSALMYITSGSYNTADGTGAGASLADGASPNLNADNCTYLGAFTKPLQDGGENETVIGYDAIGHGSNTATLGNDSVTDTYLKGATHIRGNSLELNSGAAGSGADWKYIIQRPATGMTALVTLTLPPNDGTAGQVLETDGAGVLSWADAASGQGVPTGGTTGQVLAKIDGTDYNTEWVDPSTPGAHTHTAADIDSETATDGYVLTADGAGNSAWEALPAGGGSGDVVGPASSTDNAISRYDGTTGKLVQDSGWLLEDDGTLAKYNVTGTDYEKFGISWGSNLLTLATSKGGTGTNRDMEINVGGSKWHFRTDGAVWVDAAGQTVGNARGVGAVDLQPWRNTATKVASGTYSHAWGFHNLASGEGSTAGGYGCTASGDKALALGSVCAAPGSYSAAFNGYSNATKDYTIAGGRASDAFVACSFVMGAKYSLTGTYQAGFFQFSNETTNATQTKLYPQALSGSKVVIPAKTAIAFHGECAAISSEYKAAAWTFSGLLMRDASGNTAFVGTPTVTQTAVSAGAESWAFALEALDSDESFNGLATGEAGKTIHWNGAIWFTQVSH